MRNQPYNSAPKTPCNHSNVAFRKAQVVDEILQIHGQSEHVMSCVWLFRIAMATQVGSDNAIHVGECRYIPLEDIGRAGEAMDLAMVSKRVLPVQPLTATYTRIKGGASPASS